jgi:hypothetical protein
MLAKSLNNASKWNAVVTQSGRAFGYSWRERKGVEMEFNRKINLLRMQTEARLFNYE